MHCDSCGDWADGGTFSTTAKEAREAAKAAGWVRAKIEGNWLDLCPRCKEGAFAAEVLG